jgi:hypothetical protein
MQVTVLYSGFLVGACAFGVWLVLMLRQDRTHRHALVAAAHERTRAHRRATLTARVSSTPRPTVPVVRAGSFCRVPGNLGQSKDGTVLVCESRGTGRPRWRRTEVFQRAS